jgi:hypothetical protein
VTTKPLRDARGRFVGTARTISAWVPPDERCPHCGSYVPCHCCDGVNVSGHPADAISAQPQRPHHCGICHLEKTPDAWLYCDACADRREAEFKAAQSDAEAELRTIVRAAIAMAALAAMAVGAMVLCVWWL